MLSRVAGSLCIAVAIMAMSGCDDVCSSDLVGTYGASRSPYEARLYKKGCGATTRFSYELFVTDRSDKKETFLLRFDDNGSRSWPENEKRLVCGAGVKPSEQSFGTSCFLSLSSGHRDNVSHWFHCGPEAQNVHRSHLVASGSNSA